MHASRARGIRCCFSACLPAVAHLLLYSDSNGISIDDDAATAISLRTKNICPWNETRLAFRDHPTSTCITASIRTYVRDRARQDGTSPKERPRQSAGMSLSALLPTGLSSLSSLPYPQKPYWHALLSIFISQWAIACSFHKVMSLPLEICPRSKVLPRWCSRVPSSEWNSHDMLSSRHLSRGVRHFVFLSLCCTAWLVRCFHTGRS